MTTARNALCGPSLRPLRGNVRVTLVAAGTPATRLLAAPIVERAPVPVERPTTLVSPTRATCKVPHCNLATTRARKATPRELVDCCWTHRSYVQREAGLKGRTVAEQLAAMGAT